MFRRDWLRFARSSLFGGILCKKSVTTFGGISGGGLALPNPLLPQGSLQTLVFHLFFCCMLPMYIIKIYSLFVIKYLQASLIYYKQIKYSTLCLVGSIQQKNRCNRIGFAEREGFEPPVPLGTAVFKTAVIDHSTISPDFQN